MYCRYCNEAVSYFLDPGRICHDRYLSRLTGILRGETVQTSPLLAALTGRPQAPNPVTAAGNNSAGGAAPMAVDGHPDAQQQHQGGPPAATSKLVALLNMGVTGGFDVARNAAPALCVLLRSVVHVFQCRWHVAVWLCGADDVTCGRLLVPFAAPIPVGQLESVPYNTVVLVCKVAKLVPDWLANDTALLDAVKARWDR